jgi:hypothetical protein
VRGTGSKLGEPCPKVRLSQDRLPIEPFALKGLTRTNVICANVSLRKCLFAQMSIRTNVTQPVMLSVIYVECLKQAHYTGCRYAECRSAKIFGTVVEKLFSSSPTLQTTKLERFVPATSPLCNVSYPKRFSSQVKLANIITTNTLAYLLGVPMKKKNLCSLHTWGQCYKTFYRSNLPPFLGNTIILCYKANYLGNCHGMAVNYRSILALRW